MKKEKKNEKVMCRMVGNVDLGKSVLRELGQKLNAVAAAAAGIKDEFDYSVFVTMMKSLDSVMAYSSILDNYLRLRAFGFEPVDNAVSKTDID